MDTTMISAEDIMTRRLTVTSPETSVIEAIEQLISNGVSGLPVLNSAGEFIGRFSERSGIAALDLTSAAAESVVGNALTKIAAADLMDRFGPVIDSRQDVFDSARCLIERRVSGAPVVDADHHLVGVFSEQSVMHAFVGLCWEQLPSSEVTAWLDRHAERRITEGTSLDQILDRFQRQPYRRLMVLRGGKLVGQVTRRDALKAALDACAPLLESRDNPEDSQIGLRPTVSSWMHRSVAQTTSGADVLAVANLFLRTASRQLPVVDGTRLQGQVSRSDLLRAVQRFFPDEVKGSGPQPLYLTSVDKYDAQKVL